MLDDGSTEWRASRLTNKASVQQSSSSKEKPTNTNRSQDGNNIISVPNHDEKDSDILGVRSKNEKNLTLAVANSVAQKLQNAGATVLMTRSDDTYITLEDRVHLSQSYWTDAFISLHYNAFLLHKSNGISTHYYSNGQDYRLAQEIQTALEKHTNFKSRGIQQDSYHVLRENEDLSVLVELGFITNPNDQAIILSENHPSSIANAITEGLINYFD